MKLTDFFLFGWMTKIREQHAKTKQAREEFNTAKVRYETACNKQHALYAKLIKSGNL